MFPCCNNLYREDVESKNKINFKFQGKQPNQVDFKIVIHSSVCYSELLQLFP